MNKLSDIYDLFDQFLNDEMSDSEKIDFEQRIHKDADLKKEFDLYQEIIIGIKAASEEKLINEFKELDQSIHDPVLRSTKYYLIRIAAVVVVLLIGAAVLYLSKNQKSGEELLSDSEEEIIDEIQEEINKGTKEQGKEIKIQGDPSQDKLLLAMNVYDEYFEAYPLSLAPQSRGIPADSLELAKYYYQLDEYDNCLNITDKMLKANPDNNELLFYTSICLMYQQDFETALLYLDKLSHSEDKTFDNGVKWYTALIYLRTSRLPEAIDILNHLASFDNEYAKSAEDIALTFNEKID